MKYNKKGFTLIELLVVVLIIGILSSMALPQYRKAVEKARATEAVSNIAVLMSAIDRYILANGYENRNDSSFFSALDVQMPPTKNDVKGIEYNAYCTHTLCYAGAEPKSGIYSLYAFKYKNQNSKGWQSKACYYQSRAGKAVCEGLRGLGWTIVEGSMID